jgi:hypothetical protein
MAACTELVSEPLFTGCFLEDSPFQLRVITHPSRFKDERIPFYQPFSISASYFVPASEHTNVRWNAARLVLSSLGGRGVN